MKTEELEVNVTANTENLESATDDIREAVNTLDIPNIVIRNRGDVYFTINIWKEDTTDD